MSNDQDRWQRIQQLFDAVADLPISEQAGVLDAECRNDEELRREIELLLESHQSEFDDLDSSPVRIGDADEYDSAKSVPITIPGYEILEELGRGGQCVVYRAIQESTKRKVALKVMLEGPFAGPDSKRRFEREVEVVGSLRHPGIVPIFDSGVAHGQYFYAMQYIRGTRLDECVSEQALSAEETLWLFAKVCAAVDAAHQKGVIHRDLKPSNILVDPAGEPHVLDFGLAKVGGAEVGQSQLVSLTGQIVGTLAYMSPEQASGQPDEVDMRSDVYALGVVLYELLSGTLPYDLDSSMAENLTTIQNSEPKQLRLSTGRANNEVETIVLKALSKNKPRRYPTAGALGDDIQRYLRGEPVEAKRDSALYVFKKTLRRHLVPTIIASSFALLILASSVVSTWLYLAAQRARAEEAVASSELRIQRDDAQRARKLVGQHLRDSRRSNYFSDMNLANRAITDPAGIKRVVEITDKWIPKEGETDLRDWEWYYLRSLTQSEKHVLRGHSKRIWSVAWHPNGKTMASTGYIGRMKIWNTRTGKLIALKSDDQQPDEQIRFISWSPTGDVLASVGSDNLLKLWSFEASDTQGNFLRLLASVEHPAMPDRVTWKPDGTQLATSCSDGQIRFWTNDGVKARKPISMAHGRVEWSPDSSHLAIGRLDGTILVWDLLSEKSIYELTGHTKFGPICWNHDGSQLAGCDDAVEGVGHPFRTGDSQTRHTYERNYIHPLESGWKVARDCQPRCNSKDLGSRNGRKSKDVLRTHRRSTLRAMESFWKFACF